mmetsp:Transcript_17708/g.57004  ORF Transcript_17708/g.57004 Transcript_17708/m.57004 type:complete len:312 (+) Transcript_17708:1600-2535(+)
MVFQHPHAWCSAAAPCLRSSAPTRRSSSSSGKASSETRFGCYSTRAPRTLPLRTPSPSTSTSSTPTPRTARRLHSSRLLPQLCPITRPSQPPERCSRTRPPPCYTSAARRSTDKWPACATPAPLSRSTLRRGFRRRTPPRPPSPRPSGSRRRAAMSGTTSGRPSSSPASSQSRRSCTLRASSAPRRTRLSGPKRSVQPPSPSLRGPPIRSRSTSLVAEHRGVVEHRAAAPSRPSSPPSLFRRAPMAAGPSPLTCKRERRPLASGRGCLCRSGRCCPSRLASATSQRPRHGRRGPAAGRRRGTTRWRRRTFR